MKGLSSLLGIVALLCASPQAHAEDGVEMEFLNSGTIVPTTLPFSEAVRVGDTVYLSGHIGNRPGTMELVPGGMPAEARRAMMNISTSLEAHGYSLEHVVKCTVMLADMAEWPAFNDVYRSFFSEGRYPARSAFGVSGLALDARVEVECIATSNPEL